MVVEDLSHTRAVPTEFLALSGQTSSTLLTV